MERGSLGLFFLGTIALLLDKIKMNEINVMMCVPTSLRERKGIAYSPKSDYRTTRCNKCNTEVWIGPKQIEKKKEDPSIEIMCFGCIVKEYPDVNPNDVRSLENE